MKNKICPFIILLLLTACQGEPGKSSNTDLTPKEAMLNILAFDIKALEAKGEKEFKKEGSKAEKTDAVLNLISPAISELNSVCASVKQEQVSLDKRTIVQKARLISYTFQIMGSFSKDVEKKGLDEVKKEINDTPDDKMKELGFQVCKGLQQSANAVI